MPILAIPVATVLVVALMALLLLLAWQQVATAISNLVPSWHVPGLGSLRGWIVDHIHDAYNATAGYLDRYISPLTKFITSPVAVLATLLNELGALGHSLYGLSVRIVQVTIPRAVAVLRAELAARYGVLVAFVYAVEARVRTYAAGLVTGLRADVSNLYHLTIAYIDATVNVALVRAFDAVTELRADVSNLYHQTIAYIDATVNVALVRAFDAVTELRADVSTLYHQTLATIEDRFSAARTYADKTAVAAATSAIAGLDKALVTDIDMLWPAAVTAIDDVIDVADGAFTDVVSDLRGITRELPASLPAAIAASIATAVPLLRLAKDCTIPNCRNLSQVGRDLQELFAVVEGGALLALLAAVAADPEGTASEVESGLAGGMADLAHEFADLIGVG